MLRILSDLHFHDAASRLQRLEDLEPLLDGVDTLWLNGDTCDTQSGLAPAAVAEVCAFFRARVPEVRFLTGNHDPDLSTDHWLATAGGRLCATHGDVFFEDIAPWCRHRGELAARRRAVAQQHPDLHDDRLPDRLQLHRLACVGFPSPYDPARTDWLHQTFRLAATLLPPNQPLAMLRCWRQIPDLVAARAPAWFPGSQVVVTGHVHFPRVWRRGALTVVNTGAFTGPLCAYTVDLDGETVAVRRVVGRSGRWFPGRTVATLRLAP